MTPDISVNVSGKPRVVLPNYLYERECSFVNSVNLKSKHDFEAPNSEKWLGQTFGAEKILTVWGEGVARVDQNGNPVDVRNPTLPLAIETDKGLYLGVELLLPDPHFQCALSAPFENEVFDLSRCREKAEECSKNVERELFGALNAEFSRPPFGASRVSTREPPGELTMERQFKPSLVLGSPFFERSTYLVQTWNTDAVQEFGGFFQNTEFKGFSGKRLVFLKVSHIFTRSANAKGVYSEPDPSEIRSYSERLVTATMTSVASACQALGGVMKDRICEVSSK